MRRLYVQQYSKRLIVTERTSTLLSIPFFVTEKASVYEEIRTEYRNKIQVRFIMFKLLYLLILNVCESLYNHQLDGNLFYFKIIPLSQWPSGAPDGH